MQNPDRPAKTVQILKMSLLLSWLLVVCGPVQSQGQESQHNLPSPQPGAQQAPRDAHPSRSAPSIPGTGLPSAAEPADPSSLGPSRSTSPPGNAQTSTPGTPEAPAQAPVDGGLGWLAAAGAAYAANRLREQSTSDDDE